MLTLFRQRSKTKRHKPRRNKTWSNWSSNNQETPRTRKKKFNLHLPLFRRQSFPPSKKEETKSMCNCIHLFVHCTH